MRAGVQMLRVRHACSSVAPRNAPGTRPSSGPPTGCGAAGPNAVASRIPVHEAPPLGAANRTAVAYWMPRNACTAIPPDSTAVPSSRPAGVAISTIPRQRKAAVEYHFPNVTPIRGLPGGSVTWRPSCPVQ